MNDSEDGRKSTEGPSSAGCHLCDWRGYQTVSGDRYAKAVKCGCMGTCPRCQDEGYVEIRGAEGLEGWAPCECRKLTRMLNLYNQAKIPGKFAEKTLEAFVPTHDSQEDIRRHLIKLTRTFEPGDQGLLLMGPIGTGKTHLATGFIRELLLERGIKCRFLEFHNFLSQMRDTYSLGKAESELLEPLARTEVLLVDEMGKGRKSKWEIGMLDELISERYNSERTTLITTNYTTDPDTTICETYRIRGGSRDGEEMVTQETLEERVGSRIYSRLLEMCEFHTLLGPDFRKGRLPHLAG